MDRFSRRDMFRILGAGGVMATLGAFGPTQAKASTPKRDGKNARIVIVGAGAAGLAAASRLSNLLDGAKITIIDGRKAH